MLSDHVCHQPLYQCALCKEVGCEDCMSQLHYQENEASGFQDAWFHHWFGINCFRKFLEERGWLLE